VRRHECDLLRLLHEKEQRDDGERHQANEPEQVVEGEHLRLARDLVRDQRAGLRRIGVEPELREIGSQVAVIRRDMVGELGEMNLRLAHEQPTHHRDAG
jgi:hypothetical protein